MGRVYTVEFENVSVSAAQDFFELDPASDKPVQIIGWQFTQFSDVGDAAEEILRVKIIRGHTTGGSGGTTPTPIPLKHYDTAAGFASEVNNTTIASAGTAVDLYAGGFNIRSGDLVFLPEEYRPSCTATQGFIVMRLMAAPADAITLSGTLWVLEDG